MSTLLRIDASPRGDVSNSKAIADKIVQTLVSKDAELTVTHRDLSAMESDIPSLTEETIAGFYTPKDELTAELMAATLISDELIMELQTADTLVISAPIYNFSLPASLKAWIDQIVRINETFSFDGVSFGGLVNAKKAILALSYGAKGYVDGGELAGMNFFEPYLVSLLTFLGVDEIQVFRLEGTNTLSPEIVEINKQTLFSEIDTALKAS